MRPAERRYCGLPVSQLCGTSKTLWGSDCTDLALGLAPVPLAAGKALALHSPQVRSGPEAQGKTAGGLGSQ